MATVSDLQNTMTDFASNELANATEFINTLLVDGLFTTPNVLVPSPDNVLINYDLLWDALFRLTATAPAAPSVASYNFDAVSAPSAPTLPTFATPTVLNIPDLTVVEPALTMPVMPTTAAPTAPENAPEFNAPAMPNRPTYSLPVAPTFSPVALPDPVAFDIPRLDETLPYDELTLTTNEFSYFENEYESALLDEMKAKLMRDLVNGGYGIDTEDEERLWERARERDLREAEAMMAEAMRQAAARGFPMPAGADIARMDAVRQAALEKNSSVSREIAIKKADMFVQNRQFTLEQVSKLEQMLIGLFSSVAERALNAARAHVELGVAVYNARVTKFQAQLERFKTAAQVYETKIRGAMLAIEAYKSKVEGARLSVETQRLYADVYRTQIEGVQALVGVYTSEVNAARVLAEVERTKLEGYKTQIDSYAARVAARNAEFQVYEAQLRGEQTKVNLYNAQVQAYGTRVEAYRSRTQAEAEVTRAQAIQSEALLSKYRADLDGYRTSLDKVNKQLDGALRGYSNDIQRYSATASATGKYYDLAISLQGANAGLYNEQSKLALSKAQIELSSAIELIRTRLGAITAGADAHSRNAAAALSAINSVTAAITQE